MLPPRAGGGGGVCGGLEECPPPASPPPLPPAPPQSLSLAPSSGAQQQQLLKKKSGFQITSVTPAAAQLSAAAAASLSSNNSLAEDTESYDDLDESHTEDLSSSEILDASLSRATTGPERSSSEETLNHFQEAETPGALSPNQPRLPPGGSPAAAAASVPAPPAAAPSRFRVVKLDSSSEPFRKGRWTCTEFYDKEGLGPPGAAAGEGAAAAAANRALEALRQNPPAEGPSERESPCGSSLSSGSVSTLSHYTESAGSGEMAGPLAGAPQPAADFLPGLPQSLSQSQLHQEAGFPPQKASLAAPQQPGILAMLPPQQQLPYAPSAPPPPVQPQQLPYSSMGQAPQQVSVQMAPGHMKAANPNSLQGPDYTQHQPMLQAPLSSVQPGTGAPAPAALAPGGQPSGPAHLAVAPTQPVASVQTPMPPSAGAGAGLPGMNASQQGALPPGVQQPLVANPMAPSMMPQNAAPSQGMLPLPAGMIPLGSQAGLSGLPQPLVIAPQATLLPAQSQLQSGEPLVPGMAGQQVPAISPGPAMGAVPVSGHCAANVPPPPVSLAPSKNVAPSPAVQNESLAQKFPPSSLTSASIHLPMPPNSAPFSAQPSLAQSSAGRSEEAGRSTDPLLVGIAQPLGPESGAGVPSALSDGAGSMAASLFPLKGLPLTAQLMDGEDDGCFF
ncbi:PREDICTED: TSC22 domain family protein 1 [Gekko japonicus]|uniref:TSC22 domain family protein 1 n=1 Tax=Gekko japonicus TaxID=146911 RepID=A0ABM1L630_GEKJA|nr:PREDICTED: TSC22 domain family protein 1 [Gekko japonicus]